MTTLLDLFHAFEGRGESVALIYRTEVRRLRITYAGLAALSLKMARLLEREGVRAGDRVVLWGPNSPWWVVSFWGIILRGAVAVPVDFMSGRDRAETIVDLADAAFVVQSRYKPDRVAGRPTVLMEDLPHLLALFEPIRETANPSPDDMAELVYTSGTTGNPKGVVLTHRNLIANLLQVNEHLPVVTPDFTFLSLLPLSHMFEQMGGFFTPLFKGAAIVHLRALKPSAIMEALAEEDIHAVIAVPRLLQLLRGSIERGLEALGLGAFFRWLLAMGKNLPKGARQAIFFPIGRKFGRHFTLFVSGGAPLAPDLFSFWEAMGFNIVEGYGLTECAPVLTANTMERQVEGSVGKPLPGVELKLEGGEVVVRGANVFPGYYRNEQATREAFTDDGWFRTGDLGEIDPEGGLRVKGRSKELIVTGAGVNVYPDELEEILNRLPGVAESCVIGLDRGGGEEVHAVILPDGSGRKPEEIVAEANSRLDNLHQITGFSIWPEREFPKTTTMKIRKFMVKERIKKGREEGGAVVSADTLINIISRVTDTPAGEITEESVLVRDLGLTSIGRLEMVNFLEQEFRFDLEESAIDQATRVADLRAIVEKREKMGNRYRLRLWANAPFVRGIRRFCDMFIHYPIFHAFVELEAKGLGNLAGTPSPVIFISNHLSYLDHPAIMFCLSSSWRYNTATAAWEEFFFPERAPLTIRAWKRFCFEYSTLAFNAFPLPQTRGFRKALRHMGKLADQGTNILVFPEGERSRDGGLLPFRPGLGVMVRELAMPVVPLRIHGLERVLPRGAIWPRRGKVTVVFGKPIVFAGEGHEEIVARAMQAMEEL